MTRVLSVFSVIVILTMACTTKGNTVTTDKELVYRVVSNGCTTAADFDVDLSRHVDGTYTVTLIRLKPDFCKRMSFSKQLVFSIEDLGLTGVNFTVGNKFSVLSGRTRVRSF